MISSPTKDGLAVMGCVGMILLLPFGSMLNGYALSVLWAWFMIPVFHLPALGIAQAIGISIVIGMLTKQETPTDKTQEWYTPFIMIFAKPLLSLGIGWIVRIWL